MTLFQFFIGVLIALSMIIRPFLYKPAARFFSAEMSAAFTSAWLMVGLSLSLPLFGRLLTVDALTSPYLILTALKGFLLFWLIKLQQTVNKESTSSSVFFRVYCSGARFFG